MSGFRVMVVSEDAALREILVKASEDRGFEAHPAADGIDALRQIYHVLPRVIISDLALPNLAGFELLPFVRRRFPEIGVIALGQTTEETELDATVDVLVPLDPLNLTFIADVLAGMMEQYPFRFGDADLLHKERRSAARLRADESACPFCEQLDKQANLARINALLAKTWFGLHPEDAEAERLNLDAECALNSAVAKLQEHQRREHAASHRKQSAVMTDRNDERSYMAASNG